MSMGGVREERGIDGHALGTDENLMVGNDGLDEVVMVV